MQSLHDNLLGNLSASALNQRFSGDAGLVSDLTALITGVNGNLLTRPYYSGDETGGSDAAVRAFDVANGYVPAATGQLTASDVDNGASLTWSGDAAGTYGSFSIDASTGEWSYVLDNSRPATQALAEGDTQAETFTVTVTDEHGATDTIDVTVTITGTNDAPVITGGDVATTVFEAGDLDNVVTADVAADHKFEPNQNVDATIAAALATDPRDMTALLSAVQAELPAEAGIADAIAAVWDYVDDNYSYYNNDINALAVRIGLAYADYLEAGGRPLLDVVAKFTPDGGDPGTDPDRLQSLHDNLLGNLHQSSLMDKLLGHGSGGSNASPDPLLYDELYQAIIDAGLDGRPIYSGEEGVANDALAFDIAHGLVPAATGQLTASDVDNGASLTWSGDAAGAYGSFSIDASTGEWSYVLDNSRPATQALAEGDTPTETFTVTVTDEHGATDTIDVTVTVTGTNDAPVITGGDVAGSVDESGDLVAINEAGLGGGLEPVTAPNAAAQAALDTLPGAPGTVETVLATVQSEVGGDLATAIAVVWDYLDDAYVSAGSNQDNVNEAFVRLGIEYAEYLEAGGAPLIDVVAKFTADGGDAGTDPDRLQSLHDNLLGNLSASALNQRFSGDAGLVSDLTALITGVNGNLLTRPYYSGDETGGSDAAVRAFDVANGYVPAATGQLTASDVDNGASLTWSGDAAGTYGSFSIDASTGEWSYVLDNSRPATQALAEGDTQAETFTVTVTDEHGATDTIDVTVTITGTNDAPTDIALGGTDVPVGSGAGHTIGSVTVTDVDDATFTFTITNPNGSTNADLVVVETAPGVYELQTTGSVTSLPNEVIVTATDSHGATYSEAFAITLPVQLFDAAHNLVSSFSTIQAALDAAGSVTGMPTIEVGAGTYAENLTISDGVNIVGIGSVTVTPPSGNAVTLAGDLGGENVSIDNIDIAGGTNGIYVQGTANAGKLTVANSEISDNAQHGIYVVGDDPDNDGNAPIVSGITAIEVIDTALENNGYGGGNGYGHIKLFGYEGDALFKNVEIEGATSGTAQGNRPDNAIEITGYVNNGGGNPVGAGAPDIGNIVFDNVDISGAFHKNPVAIFNFTDSSGVQILDLDLSGAESNWGPLFNIDGVEDAMIDASGYSITFPGTGDIVTEIQAIRTVRIPSGRRSSAPTRMTAS